MDIRMGSQVFNDVKIPLLWGKRAVIQHRDGRLSIIDLSGEKARVEVLADDPAPGVSFRPTAQGIMILHGENELYTYNSRERRLSSLDSGLPECRITPTATWVGSSVFSGNVISGLGVGIAVLPDGGIAMGCPVPPGLAELAV